MTEAAAPPSRNEAKLNAGLISASRSAAAASIVVPGASPLWSSGLLAPAGQAVSRSCCTMTMLAGGVRPQPTTSGNFYFLWTGL